MKLILQIDMLLKIYDTKSIEQYKKRCTESKPDNELAKDDILKVHIDSARSRMTQSRVDVEF